MSGPGFTVHIVDDDAAVLKALSRMLAARGYDVRTFASAAEFLAGHEPAVQGCVVLDVSMPGLTGLQLQQAMRDGDIDRPIIFLTGRGDIPTSVRAMKAGAADFLTKPVSEKDLLGAIERTREREASAAHQRRDLQDIRARLASLTPREREVLTLVVAGRLNKQIAFELGAAEKTIKVHRGRVMEKMGARSVVELVLTCQRAGISPDAARP
jgi:FixJ family two-component response regulator